MHNCQKYDGCSAPLCPCDDGIALRVHIKGEPICFFIRQFVKAVKPENEIEKTIFKKIEKNYDFINYDFIMKSGGADFKKRIKRASKQPSKRETKNLKKVVHTDNRKFEWYSSSVSQITLENDNTAYNDTLNQVI